jgi:hypothetical protein
MARVRLRSAKTRHLRSLNRVPERTLNRSLGPKFDVRPGGFYADLIVQALTACRVLLHVLSEAAIDCPHVLREVERASSK